MGGDVMPILAGWVLIVLSSTGPYNRPIINTERFVTEAACKQAVEIVRSKYVDRAECVRDTP
jgi:hypothetical protein